MNLDDNGYPRELPPTWLRIALIAQVALHLLLPGKELWRDPWRWIAVAPLLPGRPAVAVGRKLFNRSGAGIRPFTRLSGWSPTARTASPAPDVPRPGYWCSQPSPSSA
jgi:hypothetical protein